MNLTDRIFQRLPSPVNISSIDLAERDGQLFVRVTSAEHGSGLVRANSQLKNLISIARNLVFPFFIGKDTRTIESLVEQVYTQGRNYKYAGMPFWNCVSHVELAVLDLLGKLCDAPVHALLGEQVRDSVDVYFTSFQRDSEAIEELEGMAEFLELTGAKACKFKIGGRLGHRDPDPARTKQLIAMAKQHLPTDTQIYIDANGSYDAADAIELGKHMQDHGISLFEEPCPWQNYEETGKVSAALDIIVSGGEQDSSLGQFRRMVDNRQLGLFQPDIYYLGGLIRSLKVAKYANSKGFGIAPHGPGGGDLNIPALHLSAVTPNLWSFQEYPMRGSVTSGQLPIPMQAGLSSF